MKLLVIESSASSASVALFDEGKMIAEYFTDHKKTHSQTLLPMVDEAMKLCGISAADLDAVAVTSGPGSFTGIRIGATLAKGICMALDIPLIPVPTLDALAANITQCDNIICPVMDAKRNQVYTALYAYDDGKLRPLTDGAAMDIDDLISYVDQKYTEKKVVFLGDGADAFKSVIQNGLRKRALFAPANLNRQRAGSAGVVALDVFAAGGTVKAEEFSPNYLRQSQAEREYVTVRAVLEDDIEFIADVEREVFKDAWGAESIKRHLSNRVNGGLIAFHKDEPCGYVLFQKVSGEGELLRIAVSEKYRRAGIGRRLMTVMEEDPATDYWSLEVRAGNTAAIGLYEKMGYKAGRVRQDYYSDPREDAIIMEHMIRK